MPAVVKSLPLLHSCEISVQYKQFFSKEFPDVFFFKSKRLLRFALEYSCASNQSVGSFLLFPF